MGANICTNYQVIFPNSDNTKFRINSANITFANIFQNGDITLNYRDYVPIFKPLNITFTNGKLISNNKYKFNIRDNNVIGSNELRRLSNGGIIIRNKYGDVIIHDEIKLHVTTINDNLCTIL